jgi:signal transduction histidine kinase
LSDIPVIFLSALNESEDKLKAFRSGAVDYISKPFQIEEVHARAATHLKLHDLQRALQLQNVRLEQAVAARTLELAQANQRLTILDRSKNDFLKLISHEFRTPLNGLFGVGDLLLEDLPATPEHLELQDLFEQSRRRILSLLEDALLLTQIDANCQQLTSAPVCLSAALRRTVECTAPLAASRHVTLAPPAADLGLVVGDEDLLVRAMCALLETAVKFSIQGAVVGLAYEDAPDFLTVVIDSQGMTIPSSALAEFFDLVPVAEASTPGGDLGLGPAVAFRILSLFGASVSVANRDDASGIRLCITLRPVQQALGQCGP